MLNYVGALQYVLKELKPHFCSKPLVTPIIEFTEDEERDHEVFIGLRYELATRPVIRVGLIECA